MSDTGLSMLGVVRVMARQRADQLNSQFLTDVEWNSNISLSYKRLYDLLITSYGEDYFIAPFYNFLQNGTGNTFALPDGFTTVDNLSSLVAAAFYKLRGVDYAVNAANNDWITLRRYEQTDRNKYWPANSYNLLGYTNLRYRVSGTNILFNLPPDAGAQMRLQYIPKPVNLQPVLKVTTQTSTTTLCTDTTQLTVGMTVADFVVLQGATAVWPAGTTISSITSNTSFVTNNASLASGAMLAAFYSDYYTFDAVSGWEEFIVLDAAIKASGKEETANQDLREDRAEIIQRIIDTAPNRDAAMAPTVQDAMALEAPFANLGDGGWGGGGIGGF